MNSIKRLTTHLVKPISCILPIIVLLLSACSRGVDENKFRLQGVWELQRVTYYDCEVYYPTDEITRIRIYDDSCYYDCMTFSASTGTMITPNGFEHYTLVEKGPEDILYLQGDNTHPLTIENDSAMTIQETGSKYTWKRMKDFEEERCKDIISIVKTDVEDNEAAVRRYVFSKAEKKLKGNVNTLTYIIVGIVIGFLLFINHFYRINKEKRRVEKELLRIEQERQALPEPVRQALNTVEEDYLRSDFYLSLKKRIAAGERLRKADWDAIDTQINSVYPSFSNRLMSLYSMSPVEYQMCLLLKINATPSEIAKVLCKDASSISTMRSRLYNKVFGRKGSGREWDEFIRSL